MTASATWASSNTGVATIAAGGLASTLSLGSTTITATVGAISGNATLTVTAATLVSINVTPANTTIATLTTQERLTRREREVLRLIGQGLADKEIAAELGTSAKTTQFHVANLLDKLGAQNRTDALRIAYARGLIDV